MKDRVRLVLARRPKLRATTRKLSCALTAEKPLLPRKLGKVMGRTASFIGPRATTFKSVIRLSSLSRNRGQSMISVIRKNVRMLLAVRVEAVSKSPRQTPPEQRKTRQRSREGSL